MQTAGSILSAMNGGHTPEVTPPTREVTGLLIAWGAGDESALDKLVPLVHAELHRLALAQILRLVGGGPAGREAQGGE